MPNLAFLNAVNGFLPGAPAPAVTSTGMTAPTVPWEATNPPAPLPLPAPANGGPAMLSPAAPMTLVDNSVRAPQPGASIAAEGQPAPVPAADGGVSPLGELQVTQVSGGGYSPAHEVMTRGPKAMAALESGIQARDDAGQNISINNQLDAQAEQDMYRRQEMAAVERQKAASDVAQTERDAMQARLQHFDDTAAQLAKSSIDPNRFWASKSTGQKIASTIGLMLGGFGGGNNPAQDIIQSGIKNDIDAQKFSYDAGVEGLKGQQTAYSNAMNMYGDVRIATSVATAAALDAAKMQVNQQAAASRGFDAKNKALAITASLEDERQKNIANAMQYVPASATGSRYKIAGRVGTFTEAQAQAHQGEVAKENRGIAGQVVVEGARESAKADAARGDKAAEKEARDAALFVPTGPNGQGYKARNEAEAKDHRDKISSADEVIDLVDKIVRDRAKLGYMGRAASILPGGHGETARAAESNGGLLMGAVNRAEHFGALDKGATDVIKGISGDPLAWRGAEDVKLHVLKQNAIDSKRRLEKSVTGSKPDNIKSLGFKPTEKK